MTQTVVKIIPAEFNRAEHATALIELMNHYALDPMGGGKALNDFTIQNLAQSLADRTDAYSFIAFIDSKPVGLINCFEGFSTFQCKPLLNIHDIIVTQAYRGLGVSALLLQQVEQLAQQLGCCKLTLEVLEGNHIARSAYNKFGFKNYQLDPKTGHAVFLEKQLS